MARSEIVFLAFAAIGAYAFGFLTLAYGIPA